MNGPRTGARTRTVMMTSNEFKSHPVERDALSIAVLGVPRTANTCGNMGVSGRQNIWIASGFTGNVSTPDVGQSGEGCACDEKLNDVGGR